MDTRRKIPGEKDPEQKEEDWADAVDPNEEEDGSEPVYRDGTARNECWAEDGYTR